MAEQKRILFLTFYFEPDLCAGSFRNSPLAFELAKQSEGKNIEIDVITTFPNRYASYESNAEAVREVGNLRIERIEVPQHKSGFTDQIRSFLTYYNEVRRKIKDRNYDLVYASSSRLFTAWLGSEIARKRKIPLYLDIRDIFLDTIQDVLKNPVMKMGLFWPLKWIEWRTFGKADHINLISEGFKPYFEKYQTSGRSFYTHGIDDLFLENNFYYPEKPDHARDKRRILYAGNIGEGQGLHKIIPDAAIELGDIFEFKIIGDGGTRKQLQDQLEKRGANSVMLEPPVNRDQLIREYKQADYLLIHLNDYNAFKKVLPSKIFELGATGKPLLAGISGYSRDFMKQHLPDTIFFEPGNKESFIQALKKLENSDIRNPDRESFISMFKRKNVNRQMAKSILSTI